MTSVTKGYYGIYHKINRIFRHTYGIDYVYDPKVWALIHRVARVIHK